MLPPGTELTSEERKELEIMFEELMADKNEGRPGKRRKKLFKEKPRVPTLGVIRIVDNAIWFGLGRRLYMFKLTAERLRQLKEFIVKRQLTVELLALLFPVMTWWVDRASQQWAAAMFLMYKELLLLLMMSDHPAHQHWNATLRGLSASQHEALLRELAPFANWESGPYGKDQYLSSTFSAGMDLVVALTIKNPLLRKLWPFIAKELGLEETDEALVLWLAEMREIFGPGGQRRRVAGVARATKGDMFRFVEWYGPLRALRTRVLPNWHSWLPLGLPHVPRRESGSCGNICGNIVEFPTFPNNQS